MQRMGRGPCPGQVPSVDVACVRSGSRDAQKRPRVGRSLPGEVSAPARGRLRGARPPGSRARAAKATARIGHGPLNGRGRRGASVPASKRVRGDPGNEAVPGNPPVEALSTMILRPQAR